MSPGNGAGPGEERPGAKLPNAFILGAPKCGTTSMTTWLQGHPSVFVPEMSEPHHFNTDSGFRFSPDRSTYAWHYRKVTEAHHVVLDGSVFYLFSRDAVPNIERERPGARYVVMLRDPVSMVGSLHRQKVTSGSEDVTDVRQAWRLSGERAAGRGGTKFALDGRLLDYQAICRLGEQVERLLATVDRDRVLFLLLDDVAADPRREYLRVLTHLGVEDDGRTEFPVLNAAHVRRSMLLRRAVLFVGRASTGLKRRVGFFGGTGLLNAIDRANKRTVPLEALPQGFRAEIAAYYRDDVALLGSLIGRDLSHWSSA